MTKIFYHKTEGYGAIFDDAAKVADWPLFQTTKPAAAAASAVEVRSRRDTLLLASDTYALADRITDDWRIFRQALRDLPAQSGFPVVTWPTEPDA